MCRPDGSYEDVQCNPNNEYCWCVDMNGREKAGTRTRGAIRCQPAGKEKINQLQEIHCIPFCLYCVNQISGRTDWGKLNVVPNTKSSDCENGLALCVLSHHSSSVLVSSTVYDCTGVTFSLC